MCVICHIMELQCTFALYITTIYILYKTYFFEMLEILHFMISRKYADSAKKMTMKLNIRLKNDLRKWIHMFIWWYIYWSMTFTVNYWGETREFIDFFFSASFHQECECINLLQNSSHNSKGHWNSSVHCCHILWQFWFMKIFMWSLYKYCKFRNYWDIFLLWKMWLLCNRNN